MYKTMLVATATAEIAKVWLYMRPAKEHRIVPLYKQYNINSQGEFTAWGVGGR